MRKWIDCYMLYNSECTLEPNEGPRKYHNQILDRNLPKQNNQTIKQ